MRYIFLLLLALLPKVMQGQASLYGTITSSKGQPLEGALVAVGTLPATADANGEFELLNLRKGTHHIHVMYVGYKTIDTTIVLENSKRIVFTMYPDQVTLSEVNVRAKSLNTQEKQQSALGVQTVNEDYLRKFRAGSLMQSLERVGGITAMSIGSGQSKPVIRGLGFNRVVVTENGLKHEGQQWGADHGLEMDQYAVGKVQLIKGPASLQYGSEAIGGIIQIEKPTPPQAHTAGGSVEATGKTNNQFIGGSVQLYGRNQHWFADGRITATDYADYKVPVDYIRIYSYRAALHNNQMRNTAGRELNAHLNAGYLSEQFQSVFYLSNLQSQSGLFANAHGLEPRFVDVNLHDRSDRDIHHPNQKVNHFKLMNRTTYQRGIHNWKMEIGYQNNFREEFSDYIPHGSMPTVYPAQMSIPENLERQYQKHVYSLALSDQFKVNSHEISIGINSEIQDNNIDGWSFIMPAFNQETAGIFAYDKWQIQDKLLVHLGARFDIGHIQTERYQDWFTTAVNDLPIYVQRSQTMSKTYYSPSWALGVNYNPSQWAFRANIGQSYRMPTAKELAANGVNYHQFSYEKGNPNLDAEISYQVDLGIIWENETLALEVSPFYNYFPNYIYLNPTPVYDYSYGAGNQIYEYTQNQVMRYGGEFTADYRLSPSLKVGFVGEYVYARQLSGPKKNFTLPFSPPASGMFSIHYSRDFKWVKNVYTTLDYKLVAEQNRIAPPENKTAGYQLINLALGGSLPINNQQIELSLQVQNLLNSTNYNHTSFYRIIGVPEPGRNIILTAKIPFTI